MVVTPLLSSFNFIDTLKFGLNRLSIHLSQNNLFVCNFLGTLYFVYLRLPSPFNDILLHLLEPVFLICEKVRSQPDTRCGMFHLFFDIRDLSV